MKLVAHCQLLVDFHLVSSFEVYGLSCRNHFGNIEQCEIATWRLVVQQEVEAWRYSIVVRWKLDSEWEQSQGSQAASASTEGDRDGTAKEVGVGAVKRVKAAGKVQTKKYVVLKKHIGELQCVRVRMASKNQAETNDKVMTRPWVCWLHVSRPQAQTSVALSKSSTSSLRVLPSW